jgi:PhnB protein
MFVTDISQWRAIAEEHGRVFGDIRPTTAMVEISRLVDPEMLVEIEAVAIVTEPRTAAPAPAELTDVTPSVFATGATAYVDHLAAALGGVIVHRNLGPEGLLIQAQLQLGDSCIIVSEASPTCPPSRSAMRLHVADTAEAFARATIAGMTPASSPTAPTSGRGEACVRDRAGNLWWLVER